MQIQGKDCMGKRRRALKMTDRWLPVNDNWNGAAEQYPPWEGKETSNPFRKKKKEKRKKQTRPVQVARESRGLRAVGLSFCGCRGLYTCVRLSWRWEWWSSPPAIPRCRATRPHHCVLCTHVVFPATGHHKQYNICSLCHHTFFTVYRWNFVQHSFISFIHTYPLFFCFFFLFS